MSDSKAFELSREAKLAARDRIRRATASSSSSSHILWILETLAIGCVDIGVGLLLIVLTTALKIYAVWPLLFYGGALIAFRWLILLACPLLVKLTVPIVIIINALLMGFLVIVDVAVGALDVVMEFVNRIINVINAADKFFGGHKLTNFQFSLVKFPKISPITYTEFSTTLKVLPPTCSKFDSMWSIVGFFMQYGLHGYTCPVARVLWPLPNFYAVVETLLSWTYYGTAVPNVFQPRANCAADGTVTTYDSICAGMGVGYLFIEFFFPAIIIFIITTTIGSGILRILRATAWTLYLALEFAVVSGALLLDFLVT